MNPFKTHPNLKEAHQTSDGQFFFTANAAANHARTLDNKAVKHVTRESITKDNASTEPTPPSGTTEAPENPVAGTTDAPENTEDKTPASEPEEGQTSNEGNAAKTSYTRDQLNPMKRFELDAIAVSLGFDPVELPNKNAVIDAILEFQSKNA